LARGRRGGYDVAPTAFHPGFERGIAVLETTSLQFWTLHRTDLDTTRGEATGIKTKPATRRRRFR